MATKGNGHSGKEVSHYINMDLARALLDMKIHVSGTMMKIRKEIPEGNKFKEKSTNNNYMQGEELLQ